MTTKTSTKPASPAQKAMIVKLRDKKATAEKPILSDAQIENLKACEIDHWKNFIWSLPWPAKKVESAAAEVKKFDDYADIVDGNYAYLYNGKTHFYRITRVAGKGKWEGRTFINVQERASDELYKIYDYNMKKSVLAEIHNQGIEVSQKMFAERLGRCWRCGKSLTDEFNPYKPQGLGPDCGTKI
jgi:hypothetical protein